MRLLILLALVIPASAQYVATTFNSGANTLATPTFSPGAGTYSSTQSVTITLPGGSTGCYTTDGSTPLAATAGTCSHGTTYSTAVSVASSLTLMAIATEVAHTNSAVGSAAYVINLGGTWGIDFRATSGYVTDPPNYTYSVGEAYPITRNSTTFGWSSDNTGHVLNLSTSIDPRLAGVNYNSVAGTSCSSRGTAFEFDLPNGTGTYTLRLAIGDATSAQTTSLLICDGTTVKETYTSLACGSGSFADATGTIYTAANWPSMNTGVSITFSTGPMYIVLETGATSVIASASLTQ